MPKTETIYNFFFYSTLEVITEVGVAVHSFEGSDEEKTSYLQSQVDTDFLKAERFELPDNFQIKINGEIKKGIDFTSYRDLSIQGHAMLIFLNVFDHYNIPDNALIVTTPVRNGKVYFQGREDLRQPTTSPPSHFHVNHQKQWFEGYIDGKVFHFDRLINDDFIDAVRILHNAKHHVSAMKLLMICLDSIAYLEFGDIKDNFKLWLNSYADLSSINITPDELWEFRNSLLHMTNLDSRKVLSNKVKRLMFYVSHPSKDYVKENDEGKYFKFSDLLEVISVGISKWAKSYNTEKNKFEIFLKRYDRIISDKRMTFIYYDQL